MVELVVRILINAAALFVAVKVLPTNLLSFNWGNDWWKLLAVALVFALVNSYIKPIVKALSMPIGLLTLGLIGFVINALMLLLTALASDSLKLGFKLGSFPPTL
ncbi:MAG TPA: phage holin family protein, partial [Candidatus Limnocylindrales bacterium]|nr:phage holin family protein [Candidatus Limnocylindrales bacterium]